MSYELGIEVSQTKERLQFFDCSGYRPVGNCIDFYGSIDMVEFFMRWPRYCNSARLNALFLCFAFSLCSRNLVSTQRKCSAWLCSFFEKTSISSRYTVAKTSSFSARTWSVSCWNVAGALNSPNGSTVYSYKPHRDWKAVRCRSLSATLTCDMPTRDRFLNTPWNRLV